MKYLIKMLTWPSSQMEHFHCGDIRWDDQTSPNSNSYRLPLHFAVATHSPGCVPVSCTHHLFCISVSESKKRQTPAVWECEAESGKIKAQFNSRSRGQAVRMFAGRTVTFDPDLPPFHTHPTHRFSYLTSPLTNESFSPLSLHIYLLNSSHPFPHTLHLPHSRSPCPPTLRRLCVPREARALKAW